MEGRPPIYPSMHSFVRSLFQFVRSFIHLLFRSFISSLFRLFVYTFVHWFVYSFALSFVRSFGHSCLFFHHFVCSFLHLIYLRIGIIDSFRKRSIMLILILTNYFILVIPNHPSWLKTCWTCFVFLIYTILSIRPGGSRVIIRGTCLNAELFLNIICYEAS